MDCEMKMGGRDGAAAAAAAAAAALFDVACACTCVRRRRRGDRFLIALPEFRLNQWTPRRRERGRQGCEQVHHFKPEIP